MPCALLDVYWAPKGRWSPTYDDDHQVIDGLVTNTARDLSEHITRLSRYRVVTRDPRTKRMIRCKDWTLRPGARRGGGDTMSSAVIGLYQQQVAAALEAKARADRLLQRRRRGRAAVAVDIHRAGAGAGGRAGSRWRDVASLVEESADR